MLRLLADHVYAIEASGPPGVGSEDAWRGVLERDGVLTAAGPGGSGEAGGSENAPGLRVELR